MSEVIKLTAEECSELTIVEKGLLYEKGKRKTDGKTYCRVRFDGVVFTVGEDSGFIEAREADDLQWVKLIKGERVKKVLNEKGEEVEETVVSYNFDSFQKESAFFAKATRTAVHNARISAISRLAQTENLSESTLVSIMGALV